MFWIKFISKLITLLHSGKDPRHLAAGFALGAIIGLTPLLSLHNLLVFLAIFFFNVSIPAALFSIFVFSGFAYLLDPVFHNLGYYLLVEATPLASFWTYLYTIPWIPLTRFYNTVALGSLVMAGCAVLPIYLAFKHGVKFYQIHWAEKVRQLKVVQIVKGSSVVQFYYKVKSWGVLS